MHTTVLTLFPEMFPGPLGLSVTGRALGSAWQLETINIRDFSTDGRVDDTPYGGGAGMVMRADVLAAACADLDHHRPRYYLSPRGPVFDHNTARSLANDRGMVLLCGRYEGIDQRFLDAYRFKELSIGDYILSGGEIAAYAVIDACVRLLPDVLGNAHTHDEETFTHGLLEYPHYTRPARWQNLDVPKVLRSGNHGAINLWRRREAEHLTRRMRPDLWAQYQHSEGKPHEHN